MKHFLHFLQYNNILPIAIAVVFVGTGSAFAATNPDAFIDSTERVISPDNTYLLQKDLAKWDFDVKIRDIREDADFYYVTYSYTTIKPIAYVWQEFTVTQTLEASQKELTGKDLGLFVAKQLRELVDYERKRLVQAQAQEALHGESVKKVVTEYSGLIGKYLSESEESFSGYAPVVDEQATQTKEETVVVSSDDPSTVSYGAEPGTSPVNVQAENNLDALIEKRVNEILAEHVDAEINQSEKENSEDTIEVVVGQQDIDKEGEEETSRASSTTDETDVVEETDDSNSTSTEAEHTDGEQTVPEGTNTNTDSDVDTDLEGTPENETDQQTEPDTEPMSSDVTIDEESSPSKNTNQTAEKSTSQTKEQSESTDASPMT